MSGVRISWKGEGRLAFSNSKDPDRTSFKLQCAGQVMIEANGLRAEAATLEYDAEKGILVLSGGDSGEAVADWRADNGAGAAKMTARRIVVWLSDKRVLLENAKVMLSGATDDDPSEPLPQGKDD
ncbi:MAG: hypothetical protein ACYTG0_05385 [Planctomycetota bacterium]